MQGLEAQQDPRRSGMEDEGDEDDSLQDEYKKLNMVQTKVPILKDLTSNAVQVTGEMLLGDPSITENVDVRYPTLKIGDEVELNQFKFIKRKEFEDRVRKQKFHMGTWLQYARFEEELKEYKRCRSVFERALDIDYQNISIWLKYVEMEMRNKFTNHARNLWERMTKLLPRVDQFWFKYIYMEEILGNYIRAREIFEKWMTWKPAEKAWLSYVRFEERMKEPARCRDVMYRYLDSFPRLDVYIKVAKFEAKLKHYNDARYIFERALRDLGDEALTETFFIQWAKFEVRSKELNRARQIFRKGLDLLPREKTARLYEEYLKVEKQYGSKEDIDELVFDKRRRFYLELLAKAPQNYDPWFDLLFLEAESARKSEFPRRRELFEQAISQLPPGNEKRLWRRYIFLWIMYANFEELETNEPQKAKEVYERVLKLVPHKVFTFTKLWISFAHFLLRQSDLAGARKTLGLSLGLNPQEKILEAYIDLEEQLTNFDRCRALYSKYIELFPDRPEPWVRYAQMEVALEEHERARGLLAVAMTLPTVNMPESIWKAAIDMEISLGEFEKARELFKKLLAKTRHCKVYLAFADFELEQQNPEGMRKLLADGDKFMAGKEELKEQRKTLLEGWLQREERVGDEAHIKSVRQMQPRVQRKQRRVKFETESVDGTTQTEEGGWEEFEDYIFPDEVRAGPSTVAGAPGFAAPSLTILQRAYAKKQEQERLEREKLEKEQKMHDIVTGQS